MKSYVTADHSPPSVKHSRSAVYSAGAAIVGDEPLQETLLAERAGISGCGPDSHCLLP